MIADLSNINRLKEDFNKMVIRAAQKYTKTALSKELSFLGDYLLNWRTETSDRPEFFNLFHVIDQLSFELAVQGYLRKTDALFIRDWLQDLVSAGYKPPFINRVKNNNTSLT